MKRAYYQYTEGEHSKKLLELLAFLRRKILFDGADFNPRFFAENPYWSWGSIEFKNLPGYGTPASSFQYLYKDKLLDSTSFLAQCLYVRIKKQRYLKW